MDAEALLKSQGWRGKGHSLHPTSDSSGLTHHILIKRNDDGRGLGAKKDHKVEAWWLNAFDQALKGIDTKSGTMKQTLHDGSLQKIVKRSARDKYTGTRGLYACFVKGGTLAGSVDDGPEPEEGERKRKRRKEDKEEDKKKKTKKNKHTGAVVKEGLITPPDSGDVTPAAEEERPAQEKKESKEERRARRAEKKERKEERERKKEAKAAKLKAAKEEEEAARRIAAAEDGQSRSEGAKRRKDRKERKSAKELKRVAKEGTKDKETRDERRARRDERRKRKEDKRRLRAAGG